MALQFPATPPESGPPTLAAAAARGYFSVSEAAALLGVSRVTVCRRIRTGQLPVARLGHRTVRIAREDLERLLVPRRPEWSRLWLVPDADTPAAEVSGHVAQFYEADEFLMDAVADFIGAAL